MQSLKKLAPSASPFDTFDTSAKPVVETKSQSEIAQWWDALREEGQARKASAVAQRALSSADIEALARQVFDEFRERANTGGFTLPEQYLVQLIGEMSGMGPLMELIARPDIEDIAINLGHIYIYTTASGWEHYGPAPESAGNALRVLMDRASQRTPTPDFPITDAMLQVMVPTVDGVQRKGVRISYIMPPASPYGDYITMRISNYPTQADRSRSGMAELCLHRLPPVKRPVFSPKDFPRGEGLWTPEAANYLLAIMVNGGTLVISGTTGGGKTYVARRILQEMLDFFPPGAIRLFVVEDSNELVLNCWNGDAANDTGNIVYVVTRSALPGGPLPVTMYDLIRAALRSRPHGLIIGEARGAEAWELVRAAATGHGHSAFTIHATGAEHVWERFLQIARAHPDAKDLSTFILAQSFAEAVTAIVHIERSPRYGQVIRAIAEVAPIVERSAERPALSTIFTYDPAKDCLVPTGNRPMRPDFRASDLNLPETYFRTG